MRLNNPDESIAFHVFWCCGRPKRNSGIWVIHYEFTVLSYSLKPVSVYIYIYFKIFKMSNKPLGLKVCSLEIGFGIPMAARQRFSWPTMSWTFLLVEQVAKNSFQSDSVRLELDLHPTRLTFNFALMVFSARVSFPINTFSIIRGVHRQCVSMYPAKQPIGSADSRRPRCCDVNNKVYKLL